MIPHSTNITPLSIKDFLLLILNNVTYTFRNLEIYFTEILDNENTCMF